mmetsp:Transcript_9228/g.24235  ORF Transcript_9228/g.24235 Transcript_9228/m.24235 type:complete len:780 (+) Transcript_9228:30-2369(+)
MASCRAIGSSPFRSSQCLPEWATPSDAAEEAAQLKMALAASLSEREPARNVGCKRSFPSKLSESIPVIDVTDSEEDSMVVSAPVSAPSMPSRKTARKTSGQVGTEDSYQQHLAVGKIQAGVAGDIQELQAVCMHLRVSKVRPWQQSVLQNWRQRRDCLVLSGTGSGKSFCFQAPALMANGVVVVISPLIALMRDQVHALHCKQVSACFLGSAQPEASVERDALMGKYRIVYLCPETLVRLLDGLQSLHKTTGIALFAIDEAHCISKWGHDFRPNYLRLGLLRNTFLGVPLMALTATATARVQEEIVRELGMSDPFKQINTFYRENLRFSVRDSRCTARDLSGDLGPFFPSSASTPVASDLAQTAAAHVAAEDSEDLDEEEEEHRMRSDAAQLEDVEASSSRVEVDDAIVSSAMESFTSSSKAALPLTIIYVPTRNETESIAAWISARGYSAKPYHAKLPKSQLAATYAHFVHGSLDCVVATIAFGMGIDKSDIRRIIHYGPPQSIEQLHQETGRAGRDGGEAECILFTNLSRMPSLLPNKMRSDQETLICMEQLRSLREYEVDRSGCRAKYLIAYFGEYRDATWRCGSCDLCLGDQGCGLDFSGDCNLLFKAINDLSQHLERKAYDRMPSVVNVLTGRAHRSFKDLAALPSFGLGQHRSRQYWSSFAFALEQMGLLTRKCVRPSRYIAAPTECTAAGLRFWEALSTRKAPPWLTCWVAPADVMLGMRLAPRRKEGGTGKGAGKRQHWQSISKGGGKAGRRGRCFKCGEDGHWAIRCSRQ